MQGKLKKIKYIADINEKPENFLPTEICKQKVQSENNNYVINLKTLAN